MKTWKDYYDEAAEMERQHLRKLPIETILENVKQGRYGSYYVVWEIIGRRANLEEAGLILIEVLERDIDYLIRMNCALYALLKLMPDCPFSAADLAGDHPEMKSNVALLKKYILRKISKNHV